MPEHFLDAHQVGTVFEKVRRKTVPQNMRAGLSFPAEAPQKSVDVAPQGSYIVGVSCFV